MSFLRIGHPPSLAARLSETHERLFFLARKEPTAPHREDEEPTPRGVVSEEDDHG